MMMVIWYSVAVWASTMVHTKVGGVYFAAFWQVLAVKSCPVSHQGVCDNFWTQLLLRHLFTLVIYGKNVTGNPKHCFLYTLLHLSISCSLVMRFRLLQIWKWLLRKINKWNVSVKKDEIHLWSGLAKGFFYMLMQTLDQLSYSIASGIPVALTGVK